ncbi:WRKY transcription factor SUSIBA2-like [Silene latifolia]|uniref:WRKY transcription factor SUSIBA2-like n=1 Tax=Silene latifolia TaxID=37657 RepID=UPI003D76BE3C
MMKMEESMEGLDESRDNSVSGGESNLGASDHVNNVENSSFGVVKESPFNGYGDSNELSGSSKRGESIAERRARKCGFNAEKISTPRFRSSSSLPSPCSQSPYLTIPAGISPHLLLDSPILLPNSQLSPTTGTFAVSSFDRESQMMIPSLPGDADYNCDGGLYSMFNAHTDISSLASFSDVQNQNLVAHIDHQSLTSMQQPADFKLPVGLSNERSMHNCSAPRPPGRNFSDDRTLNSNSSTLPPSGANALLCSQVPVKNKTFMQNDLGTLYSLEEDQKESFSSAGSARTTEDGFNWRKYGQKQVKGSEYPRSYYKCTHPNCQVKKKVERSLDGQITEIIYKNTHNHPKPQPCRRSPFGAFPLNETSEAGFDSSTCVKAEGCSVWTNTQLDVRGDWQTDGLERLSSASGITEISDLPEKTSLSVLESTGTPEFSSTLANYDDDEEDAATHGNNLPGDDDEKEPDLKRRNIDTTLGSRVVRAPRVVVQIESEVDILDDGYRWRKYGQKVVKGNPNPRSYYKCTSAGCNVRKHVERASHNLKFVITTYEGKHNHEVPAARNSSHANSGAGPLPTSAPNTNTNLPLNRNPHPKPEPHVQDLPPPFDSRMGCSNDYLRSNFLGAGAPPFYQVRYPTLPNTTPYGQYGLPSHHPGYTSGIMPTMTDLSMPLSVGFPPQSTTNYSNPDRMLSSFQPMYAGQQQFEDTNVKPIRPKQEQGDESLYAVDMQNANYYDSSSSSMYNNMMGKFPS